MSDKPQNCDGCGACCMHMGHPMFFRMHGGDVESNWVSLPPDLKAEVDERTQGPDDYGEPCIWLDQKNNRCRHYGHRPQVCRDYEVGCEACLLARMKYDTPELYGIESDE